MSVETRSYQIVDRFISVAASSGIQSPDAMARQRQRKLLSCLPCRHLKVSCDRRQPCSRCVWRHRAGECVYRAFYRDKFGYEDEGLWREEKHSFFISDAGLAYQFHSADMGVNRNNQPAKTQVRLPEPENPQSSSRMSDDGKCLYSRKDSRPVWSFTNRCRTHWEPLLQKVPVQAVPHTQPSASTRSYN